MGSSDGDEKINDNLVLVNLKIFYSLMLLDFKQLISEFLTKFAFWTSWLADSHILLPNAPILVTVVGVLVRGAIVFHAEVEVSEKGS